LELARCAARARVGKATEKLNRQLAKVDSSSTVAMLERMREKVNQQESLAQAYGEIAAVETSVDADIDRALGGNSSASAGAAASLAELRRSSELDPADPQVWILLSQRIAETEPDEAREALAMARRLDPDSVDDTDPTAAGVT